MRRGTTPTLRFALSMNVDNADALFITFTQDDKVVLEKSIEDIDLDGNVIWVTLTQEETLTLTPNVTCAVQIRGRLEDGVAFESPVVGYPVSDALKDGVI